MLKKLFHIYTKETEPWRNIACEEFLLDRAEEETVTLYLWQNRRTVVIGRNQNPWKECKVEQLEADEGFLARRLSGGGAVFHDLGNLNFTFVMKKEDYDVNRQLNVLIDACARLGIKAEKTGRNDVTVDGAKFSGNAFFERRGNCYHHGTILIRTIKEDIARYLNVDPRKMQAKGVDSVRSRVCNLTDFVPDLDIDRVAHAMIEAFEREYGNGGKSTELKLSEADEQDILRRRAFFSSFDWLYGKTLPFNYERDERFAWGGLTLRLDIERGLIRTAQVDSDALEWAFFAELGRLLEGRPYKKEALEPVLTEAAQRLGCPEKIVQDVVELLMRQDPLEEEKESAAT